MRVYSKMEINKSKSITTSMLRTMWHLYETGRSTRSIAETYGYHRTTIINAFKHFCPYPIPNRKRSKIGPKEAQEICVNYRKGQNIEKLATKFKVTINTIDRILKKNKSVKRKQGESIFLTPQAEAELCSLYLQGYSIRDLAKKFEFSTHAVRYRLLRNKVELRERGKETKNRKKEIFKFCCLK